MRCDKCGAGACVTVELRSGTLEFCGHHWRMYSDALGQIALMVTDEREKVADAVIF